MSVKLVFNTSKALELPLCTMRDLHIDEITLKSPRTDGAPISVLVKTTRMDRNQTTGRKQWADDSAGDKANVDWAHNDLFAYLMQNPDLLPDGLAAVSALLGLLAKVYSRDRTDEVGTVTFEVEQ